MGIDSPHDRLEHLAHSLLHRLGNVATSVQAGTRLDGIADVPERQVGPFGLPLDGLVLARSIPQVGRAEGAYPDTLGRCFRSRASV
jgi:hypothetical protein